jgi:hypothetical protein
MAKSPPTPPDKSDDRRGQPDDSASSNPTPAVQDPLNLLIALATDDNVETDDGLEVKVDDVRNANDNALLTKNELQKYDDYKRQWAASLARPQESLNALALREKQIIEAAQNHDWDALDQLKKQVDADIEKMKYIFSNLTGEAGSL